MSTPRLWDSANGERKARLGALVIRRQILLDEVAGVDRQIEALQVEIIALERTRQLAEQLQSECMREVPDGVDSAEP